MDDSESPEEYIGKIEAEGGTAFPATFRFRKNKNYQNPGMTLRDYLAASAVPAMLAEMYASSLRQGKQVDVFGAVSSSAYELADMLLEARKK